jgi:hypothetical protein
MPNPDNGSSRFVNDCGYASLGATSVQGINQNSGQGYSSLEQGVIREGDRNDTLRPADFLANQTTSAYAGVTRVRGVDQTNLADNQGHNEGPRYPSRGRDEDVSRQKVKSIPRSLMYGGKSSWKAFYTKFSSYAEAQGWSTKECEDYLCWCLEDRASDYFAILVEGEPLDYSQLVYKLEKRFGKKELPETAMIAFNNAKQTVEESLEDWSDSVLSLATTAFQGLPDDSMYSAAIVRFCQGILDKDAGQYAANLRLKSMEDAMDAVKWFKHNNLAIFGKSRKEAKVSQVGYEGEGISVRMANLGGPTTEDRVTRIETKMSILPKLESQMALLLNRGDSGGSPSPTSHSYTSPACPIPTSQPGSVPWYPPGGSYGYPGGFPWYPQYPQYRHGYAPQPAPYQEPARQQALVRPGATSTGGTGRAPGQSKVHGTCAPRGARPIGAQSPADKKNSPSALNS